MHNSKLSYSNRNVHVDAFFQKRFQDRQRKNVKPAKHLSFFHKCCTCFFQACGKGLNTYYLIYFTIAQSTFGFVYFKQKDRHDVINNIHQNNLKPLKMLVFIESQDSFSIQVVLSTSVKSI